MAAREASGKGRSVIVENPYVAHFLIDTVGSAIGVYAYRLCNHFWHRALMWLVLSVAWTILTVQLVG